MKRAVFFTFHKDFALCLNRIEMIRALNRDVEIYGFYGGPLHELQSARDALDGVLDDIYSIEGRSGIWKWGMQDLAIRSWFTDVGKSHGFDVLHLLEWDLLIFEPLEKMFSGIGPAEVGLSALTPLDTIEREWHWTARDPFRTDWIDLMERVRKRYGYSGRPYACLNAAACLPRPFLEEYSRLDIPELAHNEIRIPLFAQILGFELRDNGIAKSIFPDEGEQKIFNAMRQEIDLKDILSELSTGGGRRAFHPYYNFIDPDELAGNGWVNPPEFHKTHRTILGSSIRSASEDYPNPARKPPKGK